MISVLLPFTMSKSIKRDPNTFEKVYKDHPVLEIGSSYCSVRQDVHDWLRDNDIQYVLTLRNSDYEILFDSKQDELAFRLRWL